jgi:hypothetical protein
VHAIAGAEWDAADCHRDRAAWLPLRQITDDVESDDDVDDD